MGRLDTVDVACPGCGRAAELTSRSGGCNVSRYALDDAPWSVLEGAHGLICPGCQTAFVVEPAPPVAVACRQCGHVGPNPGHRVGARVRVVEVVTLQVGRWVDDGIQWSTPFEGPVTTCLERLEAEQPTHWLLVAGDTDLRFEPAFLRERYAREAEGRQHERELQESARRAVLLAKGIDAVAIEAEETAHPLEAVQDPESPAGVLLLDSRRRRASFRAQDRIERLEAIHAVVSTLEAGRPVPDLVQLGGVQSGASVEALEAALAAVEVEVFRGLFASMRNRLGGTTDTTGRWPAREFATVKLIDFLQLEVHDDSAASAGSDVKVPAWARLADLRVDAAGWICLDGFPLARRRP